MLFIDCSQYVYLMNEWLNLFFTDEKIQFLWPWWLRKLLALPVTRFSQVHQSTIRRVFTHGEGIFCFNETTDIAFLMIYSVLRIIKISSKAIYFQSDKSQGRKTGNSIRSKRRFTTPSQQRRIKSLQQTGQFRFNLYLIPWITFVECLQEMCIVHGRHFSTLLELQ